jgi:rSAM/selenodomain-associated transferase 2
MNLPFLSVVIPVYNEVEEVPATLAALGWVAGREVIVVDGGSSDGTAEAAARFQVRVILSDRGRAAQMNAGAAAAGGRILLFLHADTRLPPCFEPHVCRALAQPGVVAGAFRLRFDAGSSPLLKVIACTANWRARVMQMPFGDQAIFLAADLFKRIGGFADLPIMEDLELVGRLKKRGRIAILDLPATTSARRYRVVGPLRRTLINKVAFLGYFIRVSPERIARWYERRLR